MNTLYRFTPVLARILLAAIFIASGFGKLMDPGHAAGMIASKGLPAPQALAILAGITELGGGLALAFGCGSRLAALILFLFLIPTTYLFHNPLELAGAEKMNQQIQLMKNLAIMGGLLMVFSYGPGPASVDVWVRRPRGLWGRIFGERPLGA